MADIDKMRATAANMWDQLTREDEAKAKRKRNAAVEKKKALQASLEQALGLLRRSQEVLAEVDDDDLPAGGEALEAELRGFLANPPDLEQALRERDEAVADNAALLDAHRMIGLVYLPCIEETLDAAEDGSAEMDDFDSARNALSAIDDLPIRGPHPGAALLREVLALRNGLKGVLAKVDAYNRDELHGLSSAVCAVAESALASADAAREKT